MRDVPHGLVVAVQVDGSGVNDEVVDGRGSRGLGDNEGVIASRERQGAFIDEGGCGIVAAAIEHHRTGAVFHDAAGSEHVGIQGKITHCVQIKQGTAGGDSAAADTEVARLRHDRARRNGQSVEDAGIGEKQAGEATTISRQSAAALQREAIDRVGAVEGSAGRKEDVRSGSGVGYSANRRGHEGRRGGRKIVGGSRSEVAEGGVGGCEQAEAVRVAGHQAGPRRVDTDDVRTDVIRKARRGRDDVDSAGTSRSAAKQARAGIKIQSATVPGAGRREGGDIQRGRGRAGGQAEGAHAFEVRDGVEGFRHGRCPADEAQLAAAHRQEAVSRRRHDAGRAAQAIRYNIGRVVEDQGAAFREDGRDESESCVGAGEDDRTAIDLQGIQNRAGIVSGKCPGPGANLGDAQLAGSVIGADQAGEGAAGAVGTGDELTGGIEAEILDRSRGGSADDRADLHVCLAAHVQDRISSQRYLGGRIIGRAQHEGSGVHGDCRDTGAGSS